MSFRPYVAVLAAVLLASAVKAAEPEAGVTGTIERLASSTPEEKARYAELALQEMAAAQKGMERLQASAPECVESRLPLLASLLEVSTIAETNMKRWQAAGNTVRADTELRKIAIALAESRSLLAEAEGCSTGEGQSGEDVSRRVEYNGTVTDGDETRPEESFDFDSGDDPPEASPFI
jgi:hypothetical protein